MRKILVLALVAALSYSVNAQSGQVKDTCHCPKKEKQHYSVPSKGQILNSFNDNVIIEDHTGQPMIGGIPPYVLPERSVPQVSNLKQITGSFNRYITVRRYPAPATPRPECYHRWWYSSDDNWLPFLFFLGLAAIVLFLATRPNSTPPSVTVTNNIPPAPSPVVAVPVSETELNNAIKKASESNSTFKRNKDGSYEITPPPPAEKKLEEKKD